MYVLSELDGFVVALINRNSTLRRDVHVRKNETLLYQMGVHFKR